MVLVEEVMEDSSTSTEISSSVQMFAGIEKLRGRENFFVWKFQMKNLLIHEDLWYAVGGYPEGDTTDEETKATKDLKALSKINLSLGTACIPHTVRAQTAVEAWRALENVYEDKGRIHLMQKLLSMKLEDHASLEDYISEVTSVSEKIAETGNRVDEEVLGAVLLKGLPTIVVFEPLIMSLEASGSMLSSDIVKHWLMQYYTDQAGHSDEKDQEHEQIHICENESRDVIVERVQNVTVTKWFYEITSSIVDGVFKKPVRYLKGTQQSNRSRNCWKCGQPGHIKAECPGESSGQGIGRRVASAVSETIAMRVAVAAASSVGGAFGGAVVTGVNIGAKLFRRNQ